MQNIKKYFMTLALLLTAVTGAWATDPNVYNSGTVDLRTLKVGDILMSGVTLVHAIQSFDELQLDVNRYAKDGSTQTYYQSVGAPTIGENGQIGYIGNTYTPVTEGGEAGGAWVVLSIEDQSYELIDYKIVHVGGAEAPLTVEWNASTKTGTFDMPGSHVVLTPIYAKTAAFATTGTEPDVTTLLPAAAEGVIAGTDAPLIVEGTVAFAGQNTEDTQGTVMYAVTAATATEAPALTSSDWKNTVPTAKTIADDGAEVKVWYYIQGADAPQGVAATLDNTFNNSDVCTTPLTVTVLSNKFDLTLKPANANTIDATQASKGTVTVKEGTGDAVDKTSAITAEGKLKAVKMGSEVKLKAKQGYKFRKVEVKKGAATPAATLQTVNITGYTSATLYFLPGETFGEAIANHPENTSFKIKDGSIFCNDIRLFIGNYSSNVTPNTPVEANGDYRALLI